MNWPSSTSAFHFLRDNFQRYHVLWWEYNFLTKWKKIICHHHHHHRILLIYWPSAHIGSLMNLFLENVYHTTLTLVVIWNMCSLSESKVKYTHKNCGISCSHSCLWHFLEWCRYNFKNFSFSLSLGLNVYIYFELIGYL